MSRIAPSPRPYEADMELVLERLMPPGVPALALFRVLARNPRVFRRFMAGGLLDKGSLSLRQRELVIDRTTARVGAEYEWGVHVTFFGQKAGLTSAEVEATTLEDGGSRFAPEERALLALVDELVDRRDASDETWRAAKTVLTDEQLVEVVMLTGQYVMVSTLCRALRLEPEDVAARFPQPLQRARK